MQMAAAPAPPGQWAMDGHRPSFPVTDAAVRADVEQVAAAWKHCKNVARDDGRTPDLHELLSHSVRETQYSFPPQGWPSQLRALSPIVSEMPALVMDRYAACQTVAFCGAFPEIRRAWASVDNSLFLWRFDRWQDVPIEYSGEEQSIVAVGLALPRPGVFVEAIQYLLVVCTATEVVLVGVCCSPGPSGSGDDCEEVTLQPLPLYSVPSDNVTIVSVASTPAGRIFLGGADGNLYELRYAAADSWRTKRCTKVCHTGGLRQLLPSFLPSFLFGAPQALVDLTVDSQRHILYTRTPTSAIQVYDLGADGSEAPRRVAEMSEFLTDAARAMGGREVFGRGSGDKKGAAVVHMAPVPPAESHRLHLLTVTADGRRVYWSTTSSRTSRAAAGPRPDRLRAEVARQAMPSSSSVGRAGGLAHAPARGLQVAAACHASGALLLAEVAPGESRTRLFLLTRDLTIPPIGTATGIHVAVHGLREMVVELDMAVPGEACAVRAVPAATPLALLGPAATGEASVRDELTTQNVAPPPRFVLVTTAGVLEVEKLRPADVLAQLLADRASSKTEIFFKSYGAPEAAAMCIQLAASGPPSAPAAVVTAAKAALDDAGLCGEPELRDGAAEGNAAAAGARRGPGLEEAVAGSGFNMGAVVPVAEPDWSGAHKGLCLYVARLLSPVWDEPVATPVRSSAQLLRCSLPLATLQALEDKLRALAAFLADFVARRRSRRPTSASALAYGAGEPAAKRQRLEDAARQEAAQTEAVRALVARAADGCFLLRALVEHNMGRLAARVDDSTRATLRALRFRDWVAADDGEAAAGQLISVLVSEHLEGAGGLAEDLAAALQGGCPSFFRDDDRIYYSASGLLRRAEGAAAAADRAALTRDAVALMARVPLACDLGQVLPQLALLRALDGAVELAARKAAALDPGNTAASPGAEGAAARTRREEAAYCHLTAVLRVLSDPSAPAPGPLEAFQKSLSGADRERLRPELLRLTAASEDALLQEGVFGALLDMGAVRDLLALDSPQLEPYLVRASELGAAAGGGPPSPLQPAQVAAGEALARLYIARQQYAAAAGVYELLASRPAVPGSQTPSLEQRAADLQAAVLQARSCGDAALVDRLEAKARLAALQQRLAEQLDCLAAEAEGGEAAVPGAEATAEECAGAAADLRRDLASLEALYNDYARRYRRWGPCLELIHISGYADAGYVRQLWDLLLKDAWQRGWDAAGGGDSERCEGGLHAAARAAAELGERFFPNEASFPAPHVLMRLEQAAAGQWPVRSEVALDAGPARRALLAACGGAYDAVVRAYEVLLSTRGADPHGEELHSPYLRLRLLRSLREVVQAGHDRAVDRAPAAGYAGARAGRRVLGVLAAACEAYAAEARRLPQGREAAEVATQFEALGQSLQRLMGFREGAYAL